MWFKKLTQYPKQVLHPKQKALLEYIDQTLIELHENKPVNGQMNIKFVGVDFRSTLLPLSFIIDKMQLELGTGYIPRSVALLSDPRGNWLIYYAVRSETGTDEITTALFLDVLARTNNARTGE